MHGITAGVLITRDANLHHHSCTAGVLSYASDNRVTVTVDRWRRNQRNIFENFFLKLIICSDDEL